MAFPEVTRVVYGRKPLQQVICQLRFPPILKIDSELPAKFQDKIHNIFPEYSESTNLQIDLPQSFPGQMPNTINRIFQPSNIKNYLFSSEDGKWMLNLTRTYIALTADSVYERWEQFKDKIKDPLTFFMDEYSPSYYSRIGLRYINIFRRSEFGLKDVDWNELLKPYILGIISSPDVSTNVKDYESSTEIVLEDNQSIVRVLAKLIHDPSEGNIFILDNDFFLTKNTEPKKVFEKLDFLNANSSRFIQWAITPKLHTAMEPQAI